MKKKRTSKKSITVYDNADTTAFIDQSNPVKFEDIGLTIPPTPPSQVVSIRLPTKLLNVIRAIGSEMDVPYQALIKQFLFESVKKLKKSA